MADAAFTRHKDHPRRAQFGHKDGVMPCPADDVHVGKTQFIGRIAHRIDAIAVEVQRREVSRRGQLKTQAMLLAGGFDDLTDLRNHRVQPLGQQMTKIEGHAHFAGDDVARAGIGLQAADRAASMGLMAQRSLVDSRDHRRRADQRILAQVHRRWPGVRFNTTQVEVEPFLAQGPEHHADGFALVFQDRTLLDMRLKIGTDRVPVHRSTTRITDSIQCLTDGHAVGIGFGQSFFQGEFIGEYPRAHHARCKARTFFVGPHHDFQRCFGLNVQVIKAAQHFNPGQHAIAAVKLAARGLGVDVAASHHGRQVGVGARSPGKNIAHRIDADGTPRLFAPAHKQVAGLAV